MKMLLINTRFKFKIKLIGSALLISSFSFGQTNQNFTINYNGISKSDKSPHVDNKDGDIGLKNPERGFSIRAGVIDFYSNSDHPTQSYFENITSNYSSLLSPLSFYIDEYEDDGISLVETEVYVNYQDSLLQNPTTISSVDINKPSAEVLPVFHSLGVKTHLVLNSSFTYHETDPDGILNQCEENDVRSTKNLGYFDALEPFFESVRPYTALVHLGWISAPWNSDEYRLSSHWERTNWSYNTIYPLGNIDKSTQYKNHHNTLRESTQRSSWGQIANKASIWHYQSGINKLKKEIIDKTLTSFPDQKVLLKSTMAIGNYIGTALNSTAPPSPVWSPTNSTNHIEKILSGTYDNFGVDEAISHLKTEEGFLRFGYYDHAFGAETYDHYWTIGNSSSQYIPWNNTITGSEGVEWAGNPYFTDVYNLRKYRTNLWVHGEMPIYQTEDTLINLSRNPHAWSTSSFNMNHSYHESWYQFPFNTPPGIQNKRYDYEIAEGISSGRLQDGFYSALKLRYFNYSSFNITHNNLLDGRSPYEMEDGFTQHTDGLSNGTLQGMGIPNKENTAIQKWKEKLIDKNKLELFGMPVSDRYFEDASGNTIERTAYEYIRDHLGYRLELQSTLFKPTSNSILFNTTIKNRGFAMPQNKRNIYFVLLNSNNEVVKSELTDYDWRGWEPDVFAVANLGEDNLVTNPVGSGTLPLDQIKVGGIPLGDQNSDWFKESISPTYSPYNHTLYGSFNLSGLPNGQYKVGIVLPDIDKDLYDNPDYSVKFANQAKYLDCKGITVLGSFLVGGVGVLDSDADGIPNSIDVNPYNPIELSQSGVVPEQVPCELLQSLNTTHYSNPNSSTTIYFNTELSELTTNENFDVVEIFDVQGKLIERITNPLKTVKLSNLTTGLYFVHLYKNGNHTVKKIIK